MKIACEIVKDLLPLYHDNVCSDESRSTIEEHLLECDACKKYLDSMNSDFIPNDIDKATEAANFNALRGIKKKLHRKNVKISIISVVCAMLVFLGGFSFLFVYQIPIKYEEGMLSVNMAYDEVIDIVFNDKDYYRSYGFAKTIEIDGAEQNVVFIYYVDSIWTKYFSTPHNDEPYQFSIGQNIIVDYGKDGKSIQSKKDISAVYYLIDDYQNLSQIPDEEFTKAMGKAILIWKK